MDEASGLVLESPDTEDVEERVILSVEDGVDGSVAELGTDLDHKVRQTCHGIILLNSVSLRVLYALITQVIKWRLMCLSSNVIMVGRTCCMSMYSAQRSAGAQCPASFGRLLSVC